MRTRRLEQAILAWTNLRGWRTKRRIVVFESDDWGGVRMRDPATRRSLEKLGFDLDSIPYDRLDCLENRSDLDSLLNLLSQYQTISGAPPKFTFNAVLGNPDFEKIKENDFEKFEHQTFLDSYLYYHGDDLRPIWNSAIAMSLVKPQFHAREHLNVDLWLNDLRSGLLETRQAFDHHYFGQTMTTSSPRQRNYLAAFWPESKTHMNQIKHIVKDGLHRFREIFEFSSRTFVACNYIMPRQLERTIIDEGVDLIQGQRGHLEPSEDGRVVGTRRNYTGQKNKLGLYYSVRNVRFEPFEDRSRDWVASALAEIGLSFSFGKPAIVSTHRVNYVSGMSIENRDRNLRLLGSLLQNIFEKWPDVEIVSSDELAQIMAT